MAENKIPKRSQVPVEYTWDLSHMFESDEAWHKENEELKKLPAQILEFRGKLGESAESLLSYLRLRDQVAWSRVTANRI